MKKTVYFTSQQYNFSDLEKAIENAVEKRDEFITNQSNEVVKIDSEEIQFVTVGNNLTRAVITLTYFTKV